MASPSSHLLTRFGLRTLVLCGALALVSGCGDPTELSESSAVPTMVTTELIRQTDDVGNELPFRTSYPNRWNNLNDGSSYEPCTALTSQQLASLELIAESAADIALADRQTARGCKWEFSDLRLAHISQIVGNGPDLPTYKSKQASTVQWQPDSEIAGRSVAIGTEPSSNSCTAYVRSGTAIVATGAAIPINPPPTPEICAKALAFTRATIDKMPP
ncbi:DUF3558 family protein [Gordonia sp. NPDC003504]